MSLQVGDKVRISPYHPLLGKTMKYSGDKQGEVVSCGSATLLNGFEVPTASVKWPTGNGFLVWTYHADVLIKVDEVVYEDGEVL